MFNKVAADAVVVIHFLWIIFLIFGAILGRRYRHIQILHIAGLFFAVIIQIFGWYCPLTYLEMWLRVKHDPLLTYGGSFIVHYLEKLIYIELSSGTIFILTLLLILVTSYIYYAKSKNLSKNKNI